MGGHGEAGGARTGGTSRAVDRTVFWNLVVHFREHCLPITFLLADASAGEEIPPPPSNCSSHSRRCLFCFGAPFGPRAQPQRSSFRSVVFHALFYGPGSCRGWCGGSWLRAHCS